MCAPAALTISHLTPQAFTGTVHQNHFSSPLHPKPFSSPLVQRKQRTPALVAFPALALQQQSTVVRVFRAQFVIKRKFTPRCNLGQRKHQHMPTTTDVHFMHRGVWHTGMVEVFQRVQGGTPSTIQDQFMRTIFEDHGKMLVVV